MIKQEDFIFNLTNELHDNVAEIYESLIDGELTEGFQQIDSLRSKLKALKDNLTKKEEV